jgi:hypothetical protein
MPPVHFGDPLSSRRIQSSFAPKRRPWCVRLGTLRIRAWGQMTIDINLQCSLASSTLASTMHRARTVLKLNRRRARRQSAGSGRISGPAMRAGLALAVRIARLKAAAMEEILHATSAARGRHARDRAAAIVAELQRAGRCAPGQAVGQAPRARGASLVRVRLLPNLAGAVLPQAPRLPLGTTRLPLIGARSETLCSSNGLVRRGAWPFHASGKNRGDDFDSRGDLGRMRQYSCQFIPQPPQYRLLPLGLGHLSIERIETLDRLAVLVPVKEC